MERVVIVINPAGPERTALEFACHLSESTGSRLTGLFLHENDVAEVHENKHEWHICQDHKVPEATYEISPADIERNKKEFSRFCQNHNLVGTPDIQDARTVQDVIIESRFADFLIISANSSFSHEAEIIPTHLVAHILKNSEGPVIIAPLSFTNVQEIVFTYDGSPSSVFAIKQFTHLFPQFKNVKVTFLEVNDDENPDIEHKELITAYLKTHYSTISFHVLKGEPEDQLFSYFLTKRNVFVVLGAFGKNLISSIFKRSTANLLLKTTSLPLFISHK